MMIPNNKTVYTEKAGIDSISQHLASAITKGELGNIIAEVVNDYTLMDLQVIGGNLYNEIEMLPEPYRTRIRPYFQEQIFGAYHRLMLMSRSNSFKNMNEPIRDRDLFQKMCLMIPDGCFSWDESAKRTPFHYSSKHRFFYYLISAFTMFVLDLPGHPVGMPFPGGFTVEKRANAYYCLIRDKEKDVFFSICNYCPARQTEENNR